MAEIKFNDSFHSEIDTLSEAGAEVTSNSKSISTSGIGTLPTATAFEQERREILNLLRAYESLIRKEAGDLNNLMEAVNQADQSIANSYGSN